jgi:hypothetical protein
MVPTDCMSRVRQGITRRSFLTRSVAALLATYGALLHGLSGAGINDAEATPGTGAELGTEGAMLGAMQLGS